MNILVTGADGFIGKNLVTRLHESPRFTVSTFVRGDSDEVLKNKLYDVDTIIHLAGENRPASEEGFQIGNVDLTDRLCNLLRELKKPVRFILSSSTQANLDNAYGKSKLAAEAYVESFAEDTGSSVVIYRLPGVFGKWCKPNYNSVVATFCFNIANDLPIIVNDPSSELTLVYVDDVINSFIDFLSEDRSKGLLRKSVIPEYSTTLAELASQIKKFGNCRSDLLSERVGKDFTRALYATYVSYLPKDKFQYQIPSHEDARGVFVEMLKTKDSGQFSYFTAYPGITRGGHYHHTKTEKFLVIKGAARFGFRHIITGETFKIDISAGTPEIVETIPGWSHDITNIGDDEMIVMLWANEIFDKDNPDTISSIV
jgi:UDP-2-acetamido-2,6-beta-L-arabino-hexul-4-ose reductase